MAEKKTHNKPVGTSGPIEFGFEGVIRHDVSFPKAKKEIELFIASGFCNPGRVSYLPHIKRYSHFLELQQQQENSLDFQVTTRFGERWLELCEFAPLEHFGGKHENVPEEWDVSRMLDLFLRLVEKKDLKCGGHNVILLIYKTHRTLLVPPPILRAARQQLRNGPPSFESIYYISPHSSSEMSVWEVWPGDYVDEGPAITYGKVIVGP